jgi:hypothetical protein
VRRTWKWLAMDTREKRRQRHGESAVEYFACGGSGKIVRSDNLC